MVTLVFQVICSEVCDHTAWLVKGVNARNIVCQWSLLNPAREHVETSLQPHALVVKSLKNTWSSHKRLAINNTNDKVAKSNPKLAQIPLINPRYIWVPYVFITHLIQQSLFLFRVSKIFTHKNQLTADNCMSFTPEQWKLPGDVKYGVETKLERFGRQGVRLADFLSSFLQNVDGEQNYGM